VTLDYKKAGVDVAAGDALVEWLKATQPASFPHKDKLVAGIGGFAALFKADFSAMKEPCLVSCTDGVGTKVKLASHFGRYREVGQDLVAMCVNDMICSGARPLFFLDYYATGKLELDAAKDFLAGVRDACIESDCALIGGETAEMPGVYQAGDFDCAGFSVGVVDKAAALGPHRVSAGDELIAVASSGFHSNGYSLLRKVFESDLADWADRLLIPTALYVKLADALSKAGGVKAIAHITGGGMENLPRVLPVFTKAVIQPWAIPDGFREVQKRSGMTWDQMVTTLNCGVGLVVVCESANAAQLIKTAGQAGHKAFRLGMVEKAESAEASWELAPGSQWGKM
jgi:phosphoribosylformylglycinamidine cyclo-ligase